MKASTLPMNGLTARLSLDLLALRPNQTIAVTAAAGIYGSYLIQLAKNEGLIVIADASKDDFELVKSLGAVEIIPRGDSFADNLLKIFPNGVDGLADGVILN